MSTLPVVNTEALRELLEAFLAHQSKNGASASTLGQYRAAFRQVRMFADTCPREGPAPEPRPVLPEDTFTVAQLDGYLQYLERTARPSTVSSGRSVLSGFRKWARDNQPPTPDGGVVVRESAPVDEPSTTPDGEQPSPLRMVPGTPEAMAPSKKTEAGNMSTAARVKEKLGFASDHAARAGQALEEVYSLTEEAADVLAAADADGAARQVKLDLWQLHDMVGKLTAELASVATILGDCRNRLGEGPRHG